MPAREFQPTRRPVRRSLRASPTHFLPALFPGLLAPGTRAQRGVGVEAVLGLGLARERGGSHAELRAINGKGATDAIIE